ncbi:MAG: hypothetical protein AVDCRST_MAG79-346 [uncultured Thermoleophilia bacterium]|uniref:Uncharacterized protein n=1 Tax=uncultured Thermoleophilia bacterium TaxID=1497501 RepID=A0A6J4TIS6_9ACTN|nr:MAG: hypothetical protein AVDCRST_MAG79-346 [uncultured Thermoleophilia bacterium]
MRRPPQHLGSRHPPGRTIPTRSTQDSRSTTSSAPRSAAISRQLTEGQHGLEAGDPAAGHDGAVAGAGGVGGQHGPASGRRWIMVPACCPTARSTSAVARARLRETRTSASFRHRRPRGGRRPRREPDDDVSVLASDVDGGVHTSPADQQPHRVAGPEILPPLPAAQRPDDERAVLAAVVHRRPAHPPGASPGGLHHEDVPAQRGVQRRTQDGHHDGIDDVAHRRVPEAHVRPDAPRGTRCGALSRRRTPWRSGTPAWS